MSETNVPPQFPGTTLVGAPVTILSGPAGIKAQWRMDRHLVWKDSIGTMFVADNITADEVAEAIELLMAQTGAIE